MRPLGIPQRGALVNRAHPLARALVMCHAFNEGVGEHLFDASGNGHHGDTWNNNPTWDGGNSRLGSAVRMGDTDNCNIVMAEQGWIHSDQPFTVGMWLKLANVDGTRNILTTSTGDFTASLIISGAVNFRFYITGATRGTKVLVPNVWYHYVATFDGSQAQIYTNGLADGAPDAMSGKYSAVCSYRWGHISTTDVEGHISMGYAWNRCLAPAEIAWLYRDPWTMFRRFDLRPPAAPWPSQFVRVR